MSTSTSRWSFAVLLLVSSTAFADRCEFSASRNLDIDAAGVQKLALEFGSDDLNLKGVPGQARIEVRGRACASSQAALDSMKLDQSRSGDTVSVTVSKEGLRGTWFGSSYAYINLEVRVPQTLLVAIKRGSGDVEIENVAGVDSTAGSGDLDARDITGPVVIRAGSGDATLRQTGAVTVRALGSGDVQAHQVRGDVVVEGAGSSTLTFNDVTGNVSIDHIGSGDVNVRSIGGDVHVGSIGSGDVDADDIGGNLIVDSKGSGDVNHRGVKGRVDIPKRH